jgi:Tfp pilus assembly protein PilF
MNIVPIPIDMADRYLYLPSVGFCVLCGVMLDALARRAGVCRPAVVALTLALTAGFSVLSHRANEVWENNVTLWSNVLRQAPGFYLGANHLAAAYIERGDFARAREYLERSIALHPELAMTHINLGELFRQQGEPGKAEPEFLRALELEPGNAKALNNLGALLHEQRRFADARVRFEKAVGVDPSYWTAHHNLAMACAALGDRDCAVSHMEAAMNLHTHDPRVFLDLMNILSYAGRAEQALKWRTLLERRFSDRPPLWLAWGKLAGAAGKPEAAREACAHVISLEPGNREAIDCLARSP